MNQENFVRKFDEISFDIFAVFGLNPLKKSPYLQLFIILVNLMFQLSILVYFLAEGNLFISEDPLSKFTDIIELVGPIFVYNFTILMVFKNRNYFIEINCVVEKVNKEIILHDAKTFWNLHIKRIIRFVTYLSIMQSVGLGIEIYQIIS